VADETDLEFIEYSTDLDSRHTVKDHEPDLQQSLFFTHF
jgi:hypothetical protein